jgi:hypothetical protein
VPSWLRAGDTSEDTSGDTSGDNDFFPTPHNGTVRNSVNC